MPGVEDEPDVRARLVDERRRVAERRHERPVLLLVASTSARARPGCRAAPTRRRGRAAPRPRSRARLASSSSPAGPLGQTNALGSNGASRRMPATDRLDALLGLVRSGELRQRQDRRHRRNGRARLEPARPERLELLAPRGPRRASARRSRCRRRPRRRTRPGRPRSSR